MCLYLRYYWAYKKLITSRQTDELTQFRKYRSNLIGRESWWSSVLFSYDPFNTLFQMVAFHDIFSPNVGNEIMT
jgi:hypothetical protein